MDTVPSKLPNWVCQLEGDCFDGLCLQTEVPDENQYILEEVAHKKCFH